MRRENGFAAISRGVPALSVWSSGNGADAERIAGFCRELVERLDGEAKTLRQE